MRVVLIVLAIGLTYPALAADITVVLDQRKQDILVQALDAYVKMGGIQVTENAVELLQALREASRPVPSKPAPGEGRD